MCDPGTTGTDGIHALVTSVPNGAGVEVLAVSVAGVSSDVLTPPLVSSDAVGDECHESFR